MPLLLSRPCEQVGTMNVFFAWRAADGATEVVTPPLDGTILPGVTRDSILALMRKVRGAGGRGGRPRTPPPPALPPPVGRRARG